MAVATVPLQMGQSFHTIKLVRVGEGIQLWICSHCGHLAEKLESVIAELPAKGPTKNLYRRLSDLRERVRALETGMTTETIDFNEAYASVRQIAAHLRDLGQKYAQFSHFYETEAQKAALLIRQDIEQEKYNKLAQDVQTLEQKVNAISEQIPLARGKKRLQLQASLKGVIHNMQPVLEESQQLRKKLNEIERTLKRLDAILNPRQGLKLPCFSGETLVWTDSGAKRIDGIQIGELVLAFDLASQQVVTRSVVNVLHNKTTHFYEMQIAGQQIRATGRHPFWVSEESEWVEANKLKPGMSVRLLNGSVVPIEAVRRQEVPESRTYNLSLEEVPTYFVGAGVLVRNEGVVDYGLGGVGKVYIGTNPDYPGQIYVGETDQPIADREYDHITTAKRKLKGQLTLSDREFFKFKRGMTIKAVATGLTEKEYNWYIEEQLARHKELEGYVVINRKRIKDKSLSEYAKKMRNDLDLIKAGFC